MGGNTREVGRTSASRLLAVLGVFSAAQPVLTLSEIAEASELPASTAHRLLGELVEWGALERTSDGHYQVGLRLWRIGSLAPQQRDLRAVALPFMEDLYAATHENVQLAIRDGKKALYLDKIGGTRSVDTVTKVAGRLPLHATGVGKIILAFSEPELLHLVVEDGLERCTPHTITMPGRLAETLRRVRADHVAYSREEMTMGAASVAAPIFGVNAQLLASLAIVAHSSSDVERFAPAVRTAALSVGRRLADLSAPVSARR
ncbi:IclR family transcriptional regulator [Saccharopolyspora sp. ASAGF58]|uniref:IclR family transcriptional regulator n=1 Tax=Saccharopolyspora sp. ASAGF58 TaxID=2719023 RepID=UPI00143FDA6E|nr:IclR family transcriptional regulator [Saccharopolyspora sp. ASAGF58]QIZ37256.1 IclR family transcriptional regulator [Saccharopolyspora sp. ASAGF58]